MLSANPVSACLSEVQRAFKDGKASGDMEQASRHYWSLTTQMLVSVSGLSKNERSALKESLRREDCGLLFGIAMSAAIWSIRQQDSSRLRFGLLALIVEDCKEDYRETLMHLCLLNHSAAKLRISLPALYAELGPVASSATAQMIDGYFRDGEKDIAAMGYRETHGPDGFGYERT